MSNPQQPELRRSDKGAGTPQDSRSRKAAQGAQEGGGHAHGTDRGNKGGGRGGGTPPEQQPDHPA
ncbi:hypothetical protein GCM10010145_64940 [Streptomyces ruber]|uniref:Uncharacterized protein n=2 Tax=Streptomyces TaxID=1883 RepID=A0A918EZM2_9ACTN|nr:hypothetical protein [Streptomyces ruber]GGQ86477.1 hypothetical protein GCM10010145_64940 [Streptomyces ruber]